jgi:3-hydroxyacyl-CoA dehydrogenase
MPSIVEERMGKLDTVVLERERDDLLGEIIRLKEEKKALT